MVPGLVHGTEDWDLSAPPASPPIASPGCTVPILPGALPLGFAPRVPQADQVLPAPAGLNLGRKNKRGGQYLLRLPVPKETEFLTSHG